MRHMAFYQRNAFHKNKEGILLHRQGILLHSSVTYRYTFNSIHRSVLHINSKEKGKEVKLIV